MTTNKLTERRTVLMILLLATTVSSQTGGPFAITQSVVANGTTTTAGGSFSLDATPGQSVAGTTSAGPHLIVTGGFWQSNLAPTAAGASITGRVLTSDGRGIRNAVLELTDPSGRSTTVISGTLGHYQFTDVRSGQSYVLTISSMRFSFVDPTRLLVANDQMVSQDLVALP